MINLLLNNAFSVIGCGIGLLFLTDAFTGFKFTKSVWNIIKLKKDEIREQIRDPKADAQAAVATLKSDLLSLKKTKSDLGVRKQLESTQLLKLQQEINNKEALAQKIGSTTDQSVEVKTRDLIFVLNQKADLEARCATLEKSLDEISTMHARAGAQIQEYIIAIGKAETELNSLTTSIEMSNLTTRLNNSLLNYSSPDNALESIRRDAEKAKARAEASTDSSASVEDKYDVKPGISESDLAKYMSK